MRWIFFEGAGSPFVEESSTSFPHAIAALQLDDTITIPAGTNRVLLDFVGITTPSPYTDVLDPAGANISLTELTGSPAVFIVGADEYTVGFRLLEAAFGTTGSKVLRFTPVASRTCARRVVILSGASQTLFSASNSHDANAALTVSVTRPSGTFPIGSRIYAACHAEASGTGYTVSGDVTEVEDVDAAADRWIFAAGTLASAMSSVDATFTRDVGAIVRKQAIIVVVEAA